MSCMYCGDNVDYDCFCRCHTLTLEDIQEGGIIGCDPKENYD